MRIDSSSNVILAIAPGQRELGIAVFVNDDLIYFSVKTVKNRKSKRLLLKEITEILQNLFDGFSIKIVVTKAVSQYQRLSPNLDKIVEQVKMESQQRGLQVFEVTLEQIKSTLCRDKKSTQKKAFETLLISYPELKRYWSRPNKWQNDYYAFLFSAVAVGTVYLKSLSEEDYF